MYKRDKIESVGSERGTMMTTIAMGPAQVVDVDEWLYRATRVRAFVTTPSEYVPRHRGANS